MSINNDIKKPESKKSWTFPRQTVTKLVVGDVVVARATTTSGPISINVKEFLLETLGTISSTIFDNNNLLKSLVHRSLGSKPANIEGLDDGLIMKAYLENLDYSVITVDLLLCACLLQSDSLQLNNGQYLQTTKISVRK